METKKRSELIAMQPLSESKQPQLSPLLTRSPSAERGPVRESTLRQTRMNELMEGCQQEILRQIIGPFGLTKAMFEDRDGGNVTTVHNFEKGVTATEEDQRRHEEWKSEYDRKAYDDDKSKKRVALLKDHDSEITSAYTGKQLPLDGQMHLDHVVPVKSIEANSSANLFMTQEQRVAMANSPENLVPAEQSINCSMGDKDKLEWANSERKKDPGKTNAESFEVDRSLLQQTYEEGHKHVSRTILVNQIKKQGSELAITGAKDAGKNALRQAFGILLHEFVNGSFVEIKIIVRERNQDNLVNRIVESLKRVMQRVVAKLRTALEAAIQGGIQGFVSNLLTFLINNFITTAKKVVTLIRESMKSLWEAIKLMINPPQGMPAMEVARQVTKIILAAVTTALGMLLEESVKGFIMSSPLAPLAGILSPALTAIITGIAGALVIYGIDRMFDWLSATGTEMLQAMENTLHATGQNIELMAKWLDSQLNNTQHYTEISHSYSLTEKTFDEASRSQAMTLNLQCESINGNALFLENMHTIAIEQINTEQRIIGLLNEYLENKRNK